jgi:hypothetical protein
MVDLVGEVGVVVAQRIVAQRRQVHHRVKAAQVGDLRLSDVLANVGDFDDLLGIAEGAAAVPVGIHPDDVVAALQQHGYQNRADVAQMSRNQNLHKRARSSLPRIQLAVPFGHAALRYV